MAQSVHKSLPLILAREFAANIATPVTVIDERGRLIFFNEPAERILGQTHAEVGELAQHEWTRLFSVEQLDGSPVTLDELPVGIAHREPLPGPRHAGVHDAGRHAARDRGHRIPAARQGRGLLRRRRDLLGAAPGMRATVWGCRGSLASPGPETVAFGGNTSCVQLELADGTPVVLDAGTGIRLLGLELARLPRRPIHIVLTHLHLDHLEGLGFFVPLWEPGLEIHVWGPSSPVDNLEERIAKYLSPPLFPVQLAEVPSRLTFHDLPDEEFALGSARFLAEPVSHRGPTVGLRIEEHGRTLAYIPDHEPYLGAGPAGVDPSGCRATRSRRAPRC